MFIIHVINELAVHSTYDKELIVRNMYYALLVILHVARPTTVLSIAKYKFICLLATQAGH